MTVEFGTFETLPYIIHAPADFDKNRKYPILLHIHGAGTRGITLEEYAASDSFPMMRASAGNELVIISPHCTKNSWYDLFETLIRFAHFVKDLPFADPERLYLMGISMGGYAAWQLAMSQPELFAAIVPICGGGMYWNAKRLINVPVWAFHGKLDPTVLVTESEKMVNAVNKKGGNARLTVYPENAHNAWDDTYSNPEVYRWLLTHQKSNAKPLVNEYSNNAKAFG